MEILPLLLRAKLNLKEYEMFTFTFEVKGEEVHVIVPDFSGYLNTKESKEQQIQLMKETLKRHYEKKMKEGIDDE